MQKNFHFKVWQNWTNEFIVLFFCAITLEVIILEQGYINKILSIEKLNKVIIIFSIIIIFLIIQTDYQINSTYIIKFNIIYLVLALILVTIFRLNTFTYFFLIFEFSVLPLIFLVSRLGYSLDRAKAILYMFMYTVFFSMPALFIMIFLTTKKMESIDFGISIFFFKGLTTLPVFFLLITIFFIKIPIWGFHFWLPKAHVEASVQGSIILASLVLKMGVFGLIKTLSLFFVKGYRHFFFNICIGLAMVGSIYLSISCIRQIDNKLSVALSSIVHMSPCLIISLCLNNMRIESLTLVMVSHGFVSPLIFLLIFKVYEFYKRRSLLISSGSIKERFILQVVWFLACIFNIGVPLTINFLGEINFFFICLARSLTIFFGFVLTILLNGLYNIFIFNFLNSPLSKNYFLSIFCYARTITIFIMFLIVPLISWTLDFEL